MDFLHHQETVAALTVVYCGLVGALYVDGKPEIIFAPRRIFIGLRDMIAAGAKAVVAFALRARN